jgi:hypothetical protein
MSALSTYRNKRTTSKRTKRVWVYVVLVLAMALSALAVVATQAQAVRYSDPVLMKGQTVLQHGVFAYSHWYFYENGSWCSVYADGPGMDMVLSEYPRAAIVGAGRKLHIRLNKAQRPARFTIKDHRTGRHLESTLRRVQRDGKTVAWDAYFHVNRPGHNYYLDTRVVWKPVEGTHISYGYMVHLFHVKTTE